MLQFRLNREEKLGALERFHAAEGPDDAVDPRHLGSSNLFILVFVPMNAEFMAYGSRSEFTGGCSKGGFVTDHCGALLRQNF